MSNLYEAAMLKVDSHYELAEVRSETREQLAQERLEAKRIAAEREIQQMRVELQKQNMEMQFCKSNMAQQQQQIQRQIQDNLQSKVAFNVEQGLQVGELEVDVEELQQLLKRREQQQQQQQQQQQAAQKSTCGFEERFCGCAPGLKRKHCSNCAHQKCGCPPEKDCGGPAAFQQAQTAPQKGLRPQEIPMKLPVRLTFGMDNPKIEEARIRHRLAPQQQQPQQQPQQQQQQKDPSQKIEGCDACHQGRCLLHSYFILSPLDPPPIPGDG